MVSALLTSSASGVGSILSIVTASLSLFSWFSSADGPVKAVCNSLAVLLTESPTVSNKLFSPSGFSSTDISFFSSSGFSSTDIALFSCCFSGSSGFGSSFPPKNVSRKPPPF